MTLLYNPQKLQNIIYAAHNLNPRELHTESALQGQMHNDFLDKLIEINMSSHTFTKLKRKQSLESQFRNGSFQSNYYPKSVRPQPLKLQFHSGKVPYELERIVVDMAVWGKNVPNKHRKQNYVFEGQAKLTFSQEFFYEGGLRALYIKGLEEFYRRNDLKSEQMQFDLANQHKILVKGQSPKSPHPELVNIVGFFLDIPNREIQMYAGCDDTYPIHVPNIHEVADHITLFIKGFDDVISGICQATNPKITTPIELNISKK
jgi:hypothetical protein